MEKKATILIVEDSLIVAMHLQCTLESEGYKVIGTCTSGEEALTFVQREKIDLVLMDIMLSGKLDGIETAEILKSKFDIPVIYITALTDKSTIHRAKITEPYGYLTKPFEDREIFTVIEMALYKHAIELKLKQSEEKYFSTVKSISDSVVVIDQDFLITYINPSAAALLGYSVDEAQGRLITEIVYLADTETGEFPVSPLQCPIGKLNHSTMPDSLLLKVKNGKSLPVGESSLSLMLNQQNQFVGLILIFRDLTEKKEHERLLREIEKHKMTALIEGQEKERGRIAKDLHDGLGQVLNAIKMNVNVLVEDKVKAANLSHLLDEAIQESVRISENLLPAKLKDFDLATCLRSLCKNMNEAGSAPIKFEAVGSSSELEQFRKVNLYRIAQEVLSNAIKHAQASAISMRLEERNERIHLRIEDDGKGINPIVDGRSHNGLINVKERAEILGGKILIDSQADRGTRVFIDAPVQMSSKSI